MDKACSRCGQSKPLDDFHVRRASKDGRQAICKTCHKEMDAANWIARGKEQAAERARREKVAPDRKTCRTCGKRRAASQFYTRRLSPDGLSYSCKKCSDAQNREWAKANPEQTRAIWREANRNYNLKRYGITHDDYLVMLDAQGGICAICGNGERKPNRRGETQWLSVDHNHGTGKVRAILCHACNFEVGMMERFIREPDREARLRVYLEAHA